MTGFTPVFGGGGAIYPAQQSYIPIALTADIQLQYPLEQQVGGSNIAAAIIGVIADLGPFSLQLQSATLVSPGYAILFDNLGANAFTVEDAGGNTLLSVSSGEAWVLYLKDNTTDNGSWGSFQQGAGTSSANAATLAGAGLKAITTTLNQRYQINTSAIDYTILSSDRAKINVWTGGTGQFTLPDPAVVGADWFTIVKNLGSGSLTIITAAGSIDGSASIILATDESTFLVSDGANWFTVGFGQEVNSVFDFVSIDVSGTGDYTLSGAQLNRVAYEFTGILTGNRNIIVPASVQQYWVSNLTTGAFNLTVKAAGGVDPGVVVAQNVRSILFCDGTNVVNADDASSISFPITPTQGGTGLVAYAQGDTIYASAANTIAVLAKSAVATRYLANTAANNNPQWDQVNLTNGVSGVLPVANGGSGSATLFTARAAKTVQTSRNSTAVSAADPDLAVALSVGQWDVELLVIFGSSAAPGFRWQIITPGGITGSVGYHAFVNGALVSGNMKGGNTDTTYATLGGGNDQVLRISCHLSVTIAGTISFGWAQNSSSAQPTVVFNGWINATRVA